MRRRFRTCHCHKFTFFTFRDMRFRLHHVTILCKALWSTTESVSCLMTVKTSHKCPCVHISVNSQTFSWGQSELTDQNVKLYPQFFLELITTQLKFHMVSPQLVLLIILTMQSYKFYQPNSQLTDFDLNSYLPLKFSYSRRVKANMHDT